MNRTTIVKVVTVDYIGEGIEQKVKYRRVDCTMGEYEL